MMKQKVDKSIVLVAIAALAGLEIAAMATGVDGKFFLPVVAAIAGLAGWSMPQLKFK